MNSRCYNGGRKSTRYLQERRYEDPDYDELRNLLQSWDLVQMLPFLQEEDINIRELFLMRSHHLADFLKDFSIGVRIRFEHHLSQWHALMETFHAKRQEQERKRHVQVNRTVTKKAKYSSQQQDQPDQRPEGLQKDQNETNKHDQDDDDDVVLVVPQQVIHVIMDDDEHEDNNHKKDDDEDDNVDHGEDDNVDHGEDANVDHGEDENEADDEADDEPDDETEETRYAEETGVEEHQAEEEEEQEQEVEFGCKLY